MIKYLTNNFSIINLYRKPSIKSEVVTQMIFGESFSILKKTRKWLKIKIKEDNYKGYVQNKKFSFFLKPSHKIDILKAKIYKFPNKQKKINELPFGSKIKVTDYKIKFFKFSKGWINKDDVRLEWLPSSNINFNNQYCPRDAKDQLEYFKKNIKLKNIKKNDIIFWKGHVAVALSNKKLIHAYGPKKKTVVMGVNQTINKIEQTANLKVLRIKRL